MKAILILEDNDERIVQTCRKHPTALAVKHLVELVRFPAGSLPDDVTVILAEL